MHGNGYAQYLPYNVTKLSYPMKPCRIVVGLRVKITFDDRTIAFEQISEYLAINGSQYNDTQNKAFHFM